MKLDLVEEFFGGGEQSLQFVQRIIKANVMPMHFSAVMEINRSYETATARYCAQVWVNHNFSFIRYLQLYVAFGQHFPMLIVMHSLF